MSDLLDIDKNVKVVKDILQLLPIALGIVLFRAIGLDELIIFIFAITYYLGDWIAYLFNKRKTMSERAVGYLAWANLFAWTLPLLGMFIAGATRGIHKQSKIISNNKLVILSIIGVALSFINGTGRVILEKLGK